MTGYEKETETLQEYKQLPYTLVGSTILPSEFSILLTSEGLRKIAEKTQGEDLVRITLSNREWTKYEIIHRERNHTNPRDKP